MNEIIPKGETRPVHNFKDITGLRFGRLLVVEHIGSEIVSENPTKLKAVWRVLCDCGKERVIRSSDLGSKTRSCGCLSSERTKEFNTKTKTKESYNAFSDVWQSYRCGARKRGYEFEISKDEFLEITKRNCHYCGSEPKGTRKSRTKGTVPDYIYNGIDRVDNNVGYILSNCVACCSVCNMMKLDTSASDFESHIKKIYNHLNLKTTIDPKMMQ